MRSGAPVTCDLFGTIEERGTGADRRLAGLGRASISRSALARPRAARTDGVKRWERGLNGLSPSLAAKTNFRHNNVLVYDAFILFDRRIKCPNFCFSVGS